MTKTSEPFGELHKKSMDAAMKLTQLSLENSKRLMDLQVETAQALFEDSVKNAKALAEAKDPQAAMHLRAQFAQETTQRLLETARRMGEISAEAQAEFSRMVGQQMAGSGQEMMESFQKLFSSFPGSNQNAMAMQQAFDTARTAMEQIAKASTAAFGMGGVAGKGKNVKVE